MGELHGLNWKKDRGGSGLGKKIPPPTRPFDQEAQSLKPRESV